jgi:hypothetical protein
MFYQHAWDWTVMEVHCAGCNDDSLHVMFLCPRSTQCCQQEGLNVNNNIADNLFLALHRLDKGQQELFSVTVWSIWKRKNNQVWDNIADSNQTVCERARYLITSWTFHLMYQYKFELKLQRNSMCQRHIWAFCCILEINLNSMLISYFCFYFLF